MLSPKQAFDAIKVLNPDVDTIYLDGTYHVNFRSSPDVIHGIRCIARINWPKGMTSYPAEWRKAVHHDGSFANPVPCRARDKDNDQWTSTFLVMVITPPCEEGQFLCRLDKDEGIYHFKQCEVRS